MEKLGRIAKKAWKQCLALVLAVCMVVAMQATGVAAQETGGDDSGYVSAGISVEKVEGLSDDFVMGVDISSIVSEYNSGVKYYDYDGNRLKTITDFCKFLAECGVTCVRVRVWNDPYDEDGNGYGGGNCDVDNAVAIAEACAAAGLSMMVDFHYSDFWADPSRQLVPKAWSGYSITQKEEALYDFTLESLNTIAATGVDITMVQVGNEITGGIAGVSSSDASSMCKLFKAGSAAVREFDENTKVVIHVTNPEKSYMTYWAKTLKQYSVDYDVMATSFYPYYHGTLTNLKSEMKTVISTYGKEVMVAETSWPYTLDDSDGHDNTISSGNYGDSSKYADGGGDDYTEQGQATTVRNIIEAVSDAGGIGVFYWEPAWITVGDVTGLSGSARSAQVAANKVLWEEYGSGWASSYASAYDPDNVGDYYGGSSWDNQAMFDSSGHPLESLNVWNYVKTGATASTSSADDANLISDSKAAGFEVSSADGYYIISGSAISVPSSEDVYEGNKCLHWYYASAGSGTLTYAKPISLDPGTYTFEAVAMGEKGDQVVLRVLGDDMESVIAEGDAATLTGWTEQKDEWLIPSVTFTLDEKTSVYLQVGVNYLAGGWGSVDNLYLHAVGTAKEDGGDAGTAVGDIVTKKGIKYQVTSTDKMTVKCVDGTNASGAVTIPATIKIDGDKYKVTAIASGAFLKNKGVTSVTIGKNVKKIGKNAFKKCTKLKTIKIKSESLKSVGKNAFLSINGSAKIKVPSAKLSKYKKLISGSGFEGKVKSLN